MLLLCCIARRRTLDVLNQECNPKCISNYGFCYLFHFISIMLCGGGDGVQEESVYALLWGSRRVVFLCIYMFDVHMSTLFNQSH